MVSVYEPATTPVEPSLSEFSPGSKLRLCQRVTSWSLRYGNLFNQYIDCCNYIDKFPTGQTLRSSLLHRTAGACKLLKPIAHQVLLSRHVVRWLRSLGAVPTTTNYGHRCGGAMYTRTRILLTVVCVGIVAFAAREIYRVRISGLAEVRVITRRVAEALATGDQAAIAAEPALHGHPGTIEWLMAHGKTPVIWLQSHCRTQRG